jgi:hypothetical protein
MTQGAALGYDIQSRQKAGLLLAILFTTKHPQ